MSLKCVCGLQATTEEGGGVWLCATCSQWPIRDEVVASASITFHCTCCVLSHSTVEAVEGLWCITISVNTLYTRKFCPLSFLIDWHLKVNKDISSISCLLVVLEHITVLLFHKTAKVKVHPLLIVISDIGYRPRGMGTYQLSAWPKVLASSVWHYWLWVICSIWQKINICSSLMLCFVICAAEAVITKQVNNAGFT